MLLVNRYTNSGTSPPAWVLLALSGFSVSILGPLLPFLRAGGGSDVLLAICVAAQALGALAASRRAAALERRAGRGGLARHGLVVLLAAFAGLIVGGFVVIPAAAGLGVGGTLLLTAAWSHVTDAAGDARDRALARGELVVSAAAVSVPLALAVLGEAAWRVAPVLLLTSAAAIAARVRLPAARAAKETSSSTPAAAPLGGRIILLIGCGTAVEWALVFWTASYFDLDLGYEPAQAATFAALLPAAMLAGRATLSLVAGRWHAQVLLRVGAAAVVAGMTALVAAASASVAAPAVVFAGFGASWFFPLGVALALERSRADSSSATIAAALGVASTATLVAPAAVGAVAAAAGVRAGFALLVVPLVGLAVALRPGRSTPAGGSVQPVS